MAHLVIEVARKAIERQLLATPIEVDPTTGASADILAPPFPLRQTVPTPLGTLRVQLIVRTAQLQTIVGSSQSALAFTFDEGSIEALSLGQAVGLIEGSISVSFGLLSRAASVNATTQVAQLCADFTVSNASFNLEVASRVRLENVVGAAMASMIETQISTALTTQFRSIGVQPTGLNFNYTPGVPSEDMLTVEALPGIVWVNEDSLALSLRYAPQPTPEPFQPVPFLPPGNQSAFGMWLSNDGFQRTVRNPAVRRLARDMLSDRLIDGFVHEAYTKRGGTGGMTDQDRAEGKKLLDEYLKTPQGLKDLADETPSPTGGGKLRKRVKNVPDPFSDFDVEIPELDLWLGQDRIEGRALANGKVNGFGFTAKIRFRARPVLVQEPSLGIEMHDIQIDDPDISISLPWWLEWATVILVGLIAGPVMGVVVGFLLSAIISSLAEALIPSNLGSKVPQPDARPLPGLPGGVSLTGLTVIPDHLAILGRWSIFLDDPRPFYPTVTIVDHIEREVAAGPREGWAWFNCLGVLGTVADAAPEQGTAFRYEHQAWHSQVIIEIESNAVPLPLTRFPWTVAVGYRSTKQYHFPVLPSNRQPLVAGPLAVTANVWHPEPPLNGIVATQQFTIDVQHDDEDRFMLSVPPEAGCILIAVWTKVTDASGQTWDLSHIVDVQNETVTFGTDFTDEFIQKCERGRREWQLVEEPSLLDKLWNPPVVYSRAVQEAIRKEHPAVTREIGAIIDAHGQEAYYALLAPSLIRGRR